MAFELFQKEADGGVMWRGSAATLEEAKARVEELSRGAPGEYIIMNPKGEKLFFRPGAESSQAAGE